MSNNLHSSFVFANASSLMATSQPYGMASGLDTWAGAQDVVADGLVDSTVGWRTLTSASR